MIQNPGPIRSLRPAMESLLQSAFELCSRYHSLQDLGRLITTQRESLDRPMRVAFVGKTNAGKSTMLNAFLGERLASTGNGEWTFNVSWIKYGSTKGIRVHLLDGSFEDHSFEKLDELTERGSNSKELLKKIRYLEFQHPNPMLKKFDLIDTPGLHSWYENDSRNTKELLNNPETRPHAIIFLFAETLRKEDLEELNRFHQHAGSLMSGLTAIGGLTRVDGYENDKKDGITEARRVIEQIENDHPVAMRSFYTILPTIGQAAYGAQILNDKDFETITALKEIPEERFRKLFRREFFPVKDYPDEPLIPPVADRKQLWDKLDEAGIRRAIRGLREGIPVEKTGDYIFRESGVDKLRDLVVSHFGNRAYLIKCRSTLSLIREKAFSLSQSLSGEAVAASQNIAGLVDRIIINEPRFREFTLLELFYSNKMELNEEEARDLLLITGEKGSSCASRLGYSENASLDEMIKTVQGKLQYWRSVASDPFGTMSRRNYASILADSYTHINFRIREAHKYRKIAEELLAYEI